MTKEKLEQYSTINGQFNQIKFVKSDSSEYFINPKVAFAYKAALKNMNKTNSSSLMDWDIKLLFSRNRSMDLAKVDEDQTPQKVDNS